MMAFDWFRVDASIADHPKVLRLAVGLKDQNAGWYVIRLLCWLTRYAQRGRLRDGHADVVEDAMKWRGERGALIRAMIDVGIIDEHSNGELEVHDWWEKQSTLVEKANKDAARKRKQREKEARDVSRDVRVTGADSHRDRRRDGAGTRRDETRRDETILKTDLSTTSEPPTKTPVNPPSGPVPIATGLIGKTEDPLLQAGLQIGDQTAEEAVFDHWRRVMAKAGRTVLNDKRQKLIRARLNEGFTVTELKRAVDGCRSSAWHMGENERKTTYNDLEFILRDASKVEKFRDMAPPAPAEELPADELARWFEFSVEGTRTEQVAKDRGVSEADVVPIAHAEGITREFLEEQVRPLLAASGLPLDNGKPSLASVWWAYLDDPENGKGPVPYSFKRFLVGEVFRKFLAEVAA
jgi:uncharacterized phage protein (TIGR02220 family)